MKKKKLVLYLGLLLMLTFIIYTLFKTPHVPYLETSSLQEWFRRPTPVDADRSKHKIKVAATSLSTHSDKDSCLSQIIALAQQIKQNEKDVSLIVFGEASLGRYYTQANPQRKNPQHQPTPKKLLLPQKCLHHR